VVQTDSRRSTCIDAAAPATERVPESIRTTRSILTQLFGAPEQRTFTTRLWDGFCEGPGEAASFTLVLRRPGALRRMLLPPSELALGEAYLRDDFDIEGNFERTFELVDLLVERLRSPATLARLVALLRTLPGRELPSTAGGGSARTAQLAGLRHTRRRDVSAVRHHYDVGNDFYALWLDPRLIYSCAYFPTGSEDLAAAQTAKLEHICRKLRLQPGERLLDIGCGWGGLVQYAAERYGVLALGITLSETQAAVAHERIAAAGLGDRCRVEVSDYRDLPADVLFDKVVSVGMVEHVGRAKLPAYFTAAYRYTRPGGLFLNHGIVELDRGFHGPLGPIARRLWRDGSFVQRYVFPDGELEAPSEVIRLAEAAGFELRDVESLREHYALTLRLWVRRLEDQHDAAMALIDEQTYRIWRLYMSCSAHAFAAGRLGIIQALLSKPAAGRTELPLTRADLYRAPD